jgi:hypothetical protein
MERWDGVVELAKQVFSPKVHTEASAIYKIGCRHKNVIVMVAKRS